MAVIKKPLTSLTKDLTEAERKLGVDLKLTADNDLELSNLGDIRLASAGQNAAQAIKIKLFTEVGSILLHPEIGTNLQIGEKTKNAFQIQTQIIRSLSRDERFENVNATVTVDGNTVFVDLTVSLSDTGIEVPLRFAVQR
ncbi:MAG: hypothetical protein GWN01_00790 [Nitrosopumilaceae archaeon]|nr:hypothetical protein [Nitrosopumilaceae archaeon]NIU85887.1 hypothetical protein [Nitrosopumilaceae archaeon]NIX60120.1 hypothetical protein [Nitrosopumilaceae archaeon]